MDSGGNDTAGTAHVQLARESSCQLPCGSPKLTSRNPNLCDSSHTARSFPMCHNKRALQTDYSAVRKASETQVQLEKARVSWCQCKC